MAGSVSGQARLAVASGSTTYNIGSGSCTCDDPGKNYTIVGTSKTGATVTIKGGSEQNPIRVTLDNVTIDQSSVKPSNAPITVESGHAIIMLRGTNVLKAGYKDVSMRHDWGFAGLCVPYGSACIITSADGDGSTNGSLEARGGHDKYGGAGIGTNYNDDTGTIAIRGGTVKAYGAHSAAGIGSGRDGECYTVSIEGGDVWAWGGEYAAGIGGGDAVDVGAGGTTHDIYFRGGTVHAYGGNNGGAGIGGSEGGGLGSVTITGGNITAVGCGQNGSAGSAAGIGSGDGVAFGTIDVNQESGNLTIDAKGHGEGAGIGGANSKSGTINIKLRGGTVTATGGPEAAGIGSGDDESGAINIKGNGIINAYAGMKSAAIGAGDQGHSGSITIDGDSSRLTINAYAPKPEDPNESFVSYAALIGSGDGSASDISINNANIDLHAPSRGTLSGAGIGTGSSNDMSLKDGGISNITVRNARIRFFSIYKMLGAGIGAGYGSNVKTIALDNVDYDGPTIGSSCSDRFGTDENSMQSISIANSTVKAIARGDNERNHAGVGTGPYGTIESITISSSNVEAKGVNGGAGIGSGGIYVNPGQVLHLASDDGKCGSVTITGQGTVKATGGDGGAGIGSGTLTSVKGNIRIAQGATVEAVGGLDGGAGIGGGKLCSCENITIDGATVTATGGLAAAGIGSGGVSDTTVIGGAVQTAWNTTCGSISITGKSKVTATGGEGAAGIGLGQGAQMKSGSWITVSGGTVNATGGKRGSGIGAGCESGLGRGAEGRRIKIEGEAKVTATGGAGAAGIGGGYEGGLEQCVIGLSANDPNRAFVIARGGVGAAGIGAGASSRLSSSKGTLDGAHDAKTVSIGGGFIAAYGGNGSESSDEPEGRTGPGAGIGGGSYQGDLEGCTISGGVVVAHAGAKASGAPSGGVSAEDIGCGGSRDSGGGDGSDSICLTGGTVVGGVNEHESVIVCGGSVTHPFAPNKAVDARSIGVPVYQNALTVDTSNMGIPFVFDSKKFYSLGPVSTSADYFNGDSVFAIVENGLPADRARAYLYLPAGTTDSTLAYVKPIDVMLSYYGTTVAIQRPDFENSTNVLKMGASIAIVPKRRSDPLIEGEPYIVRVGDLIGNLTSNDTACYTSIVNAQFNGYYAEDGQLTQLIPGQTNVPIYTTYSSTGTTYTDVEVTPGTAGSKMTIKAKLNGVSGAPDLYWDDGEAIFEKEIQEAPLYLEITNEDKLTKYYDGQPAIKPALDTNGTITRVQCIGTWGTSYNKTTETWPLDDTFMPSEIGYYEVTVWAKDESGTKEVTDSASFKILESPDVQVKILEDPTKYYDGTPVEDPKVEATDGATVTYAYSSGSAPTEPGVYLVTATATFSVGESQVQASDTRLFLIRKCPVDLSVEVADKVHDGQPVSPTVTATAENGLEISQTASLTYYKKQSDGTYGDGFPDAPSDIGSYYVKAERDADDRYRAAVASATFSIVEPPVPFLFVDMPETFVYDAKPVDGRPVDGDAEAKYPIVWTSSDCDRDKIAFTYYEGSDPTTGKQLEGAPTNAGDYCVVVTVPETANYQTASQVSSFTILPRPAALAISAVGNQSKESAQVAVTIAGALPDVVGKFVDVGVTYDQSGSMSAQSANSTRLAPQAVTNVKAVIENAGGSLAATYEFPHVGAGEYEVTASYSTDSNYTVKDKTDHFDKRIRGYRISAEDKTVMFGDAPFSVQAEVRDTDGSEVKDPTLTYSQVSSEDYPMVSDDAAVLGDNGTASVKNAGMSAIRVDVAGNDTHEGNFDYAVITVEKVPLPLTVTANDKVADGKPAEVSYSVEDKAYPAPYGGDVALTYFSENAGVRTQLDSAPVESGAYVVVATAEGDRNYDGAVAEASFEIKASSDSDGSDSSDSSGTPSTKPVSGNNSASSSGTNASTITKTGDGVVAWPLAVVAALGFAALVLSTRRLLEGGSQDDERMNR